MTNYDRIMNMSIEQVAAFMTDLEDGRPMEPGRVIYRIKHLKWLESEADSE